VVEAGFFGAALVDDAFAVGGSARRRATLEGSAARRYPLATGSVG